MELLAMTDEEFADYLLADLNSEINILLSDEALYGTGTDESIEGATVGATVGTAYAAGGEAEAIKAGLKALSRRAKRGAKIYVADSVALDLAFEKDSEGRYIFPIYNNTGISTIATIPVEVDEALKDGDILIGNPKNYILNFIKPVEIYPELKGKDRVIQYTAHLMVGGKAAPNKFYYVSKATA
jgi:HK97 family phage major capsid protein